MRTARALFALLVGVGALVLATPAVAAEPTRKFQADINAFFTDPPAPALGAFVSAPFTDPTDTIYATATATTRVQSAAYAGAAGTAAEGLFLYLYQVECTGGNVDWSGDANLKVPLGAAAGNLNSTLFGAKFIQVSSVPGDAAPVSSPAFPSLPLPDFSGNLNNFDLSEFGFLGGQFSEGYHDAFESADGFMVADGDNTGIVWSAALIGFVTDKPPIIGKAYVRPFSVGSTEANSVFPGYDTVAAVVPTGSEEEEPPPGEIITPPPAPVDTLPPETTKTHSPPANAAGWNNTDVTLDFVAVDMAPTGVTPSGVDHIHVDLSYDANGDGDFDDPGEFVGVEPPGPAGDAKTVVLSAEGKYLIHYGAVDLAGNAETLREQTAWIDKTPPEITATAFTRDGRPYVPSNWTNQDVTVVFTCTDALSGVASVSGPVTLTDDTAAAFVGGTCTDVADNSSGVRFGPIHIDRTPPEASCVETVNPAGSTVPPAGSTTLPGSKGGQNEDGFYKTGGKDGLSGLASLVLADTGSSFTVAVADGMNIKLVQAPGVTPNAKPGVGAIALKTQIKGDGVVVATDLAGNTATASCKVPPPPK